MAGLFIAQNGATPTTAALVKVTTAAVIKTMLQVATPSTTGILVVEWGISFDGSAAAVPIESELVITAGAATVTSLTPSKYTAGADTSLCVGGTAATGFTATAEGTPGTSQYADVQLIAPTSQYVKQWPLGREAFVPASSFLRVRVTAAVAVNAYCYVIWQE
jgi:hypothetical protein